MAKRKNGIKASFKPIARIKQLWHQAEQLAAAGKLAEEENTLRAILELAPDHYGSLFKLSCMAYEARKLPIALDYAKRAMQANYADAQGHLMLGQILSELGLTDLAEAELTIAQQLDPQNAHVLNSLAGVLAQQGHSTEAVDYYRRTIALNPDAIASYYNLATNKQFQLGDPDIALIEKLRDREKVFSADEKAWLYFALSKVYHDCGEYDRAFVELQHANAIKQEQAQNASEPRSQLTEQLTQLMQVMDGQFAQRFEAAGYAADGPVFVLGMPRSGTTLVESLLCRHPQIRGIGEVSYISNLGEACGQRLGATRPFPQFLTELPPSLCRQLGEEYVRLTQQFGVDSARIVDKTPGNFLVIGFILALLPNAKIIHCVRNPVDTCLSIYQQLFARSMDYAYDLKQVGEYYVQYRRLMDHWEGLFQERLLCVKYEDVVADSDKALRQMIDYCGLPWDDRCLQAPSEDVKIRSASVWQARQPVYSTSVQRWKHYEKHLGPLLESLKPVLVGGEY